MKSPKLPDRFSWQLYLLFSFFLFLGVALTAYFEQPTFLALPAAFPFLALALADYRKLYYLLFACIPLSLEVLIAGQYTLKVPTEPLMAVFLFILILLLLGKQKIIPRKYLLHPVTLLLGAHLLWMIFCLFYTLNFMVSFKYIIAKFWYLGAFFFIPFIVIKNYKDFGKLVYYLLLPLILVTLLILFRHAALGFSFESVNKTVVPFFRNHVNYAALLSVAFPYAFFIRYTYPKKSLARRFLNFSLIVILVGVYYSYTRAAWVAILAAAIAYPVVRYRLTRMVSIGAVALALILVAYMAHDNKYLDYAPDYDQTIYHADLEEHLQATVSFKDLSTAERIYRWVAAAHMPSERPWTGVGPGNFYPVYKRYTVPSFRTYVSDNPEQSTAHNYYLLTLTEQGIIGLIIFLLLIFTTLFTGERAYSRLKNKEDRQWLLAVLLSFILILVHILVSDLIETDKIGSLFFLNMSMMVILDIKSRKENRESQESI